MLLLEGFTPSTLRRHLGRDTALAHRIVSLAIEGLVAPEGALGRDRYFATCVRTMLDASRVMVSGMGKRGRVNGTPALFPTCT